MHSQYFEIHELVPQHIYEKYGERAWKFIDDRLILTLDTLKETFSNGTMTINNYKWGGNRKWSGLRTPISSWYSETSMHSFGKAADMVFSNYTADDVRAYILKNLDLFPYIKGLELGVSWVHLDTRNEDSLQMFRA